MTESIENNVLTVRSSHASREFLTTLRKIRDDGLFLDIVLGSDFKTHSIPLSTRQNVMLQQGFVFCSVLPI